MVDGEERGEGSDEEVRANKLISSWAYTAKPADSSVQCLAVYQEGETSATISFVVMEEQVVTLSNIEDKTKVEEDALLNNNQDKSAFVVDNQDKLKDEKTDVELKKVEVKKEGSGAHKWTKIMRTKIMLFCYQCYIKKLMKVIFTHPSFKNCLRGEL